MGTDYLDRGELFIAKLPCCSTIDDNSNPIGGLKHRISQKSTLDCSHNLTISPLCTKTLLLYSSNTTNSSTNNLGLLPSMAKSPSS